MDSFKYFLKLVCVLALFWCAGLLWFITRIPTEPAHGNIHADAIVALTGGSLRLEHAFQLLSEGRARKMFISGVENGVTLGSLLRKKEYQPFASRLSVADITLGYKARSTVGNAEETAQWMTREHIHNILLVTGSYHIPRSILELHEVAPDVTIIAEPVFPKHFEHNEWWRWGDSIRLVISEYNKYVASTLVHEFLVKT